MPRLRVSLDLPFTLDRCGMCNGLWFERGELDALETAGMLPRLYHHLNDTSQHRLVAEARRRELERQCREAVGEESFERARAFREWLHAHPEKMRLWAFLSDGEP
jgi:Zn-finger nucleic acid-binding protein